eukprot:CAMPEP_0113695518 /NCGR_PEP_ID=MMETSP0038_2-20120614/20952_1 /TAXON_ID=2898 /ORGANISM="Cryptomonas paramecium" /LENGTH=184 /DNA_ID=CAMNT_0000618085 /DNA_START=533 /DNA_END=1083 /DNA_ORIENTATION=- /assembly_acc=CAM_ASM_000170
MDELDNQRGLAHYLEHVLFLGTEKYRSSKEMKRLFAKLGMRFNADANAYTDFRSTVYTLSAPIQGNADKVEADGGAALFAGGSAVSTAGDLPPEPSTSEESPEEEDPEAERNRDNVEVVLSLLSEMAFKALIDPAAVDNERGAILSELRDRSGIGTRVSMEYYRFLHGDTRLPSRFPVGLEEQV